MLRTHLTEQWGLRYPIVGAPMAGMADGKLARAVTQAGGLGQIGTSSSTPLEYLEEEASIARGDDDARFGIGLMIWALQDRPELFDAAVAARPYLLSMSFGSPAPYVERARGRITTRLPDREERVTAVHRHAGEPCLRCGTVLQRVSFAGYELVYCPRCQTGGKVYADRRTSRFLR